MSNSNMDLMLLVITVAILVGFPTACTMKNITLKAEVATEAIKAGRDPIEATCALDSTSSTLCMAVVTKNKQ